MGGVDKSDQYLAYHNILRRTVQYWKMPFYHLVDITIVNAFILYNYLVHQTGLKVISENDFRDALVLQIIFKYGRSQRGSTPVGRPPRSDCRVKHGSILFPPAQKARCQYCKMHGTISWTQWKCPHCSLLPALCQTVERDCHADWHSPALTNFACSGSQEDSLELLPLKWTCSYCLVLLHNQGLLKVRWCNHRGDVAVLGELSTSAVAVGHIVPSDYMTLFCVLSIQ